VAAEKRKTLFSDLVNSISEGKFLTEVDYGIATRDYLGVKLWDLRATSKTPERSYHVCDFVEKNLCQLYEDDSIYDKFFLDISPDNKYLATGNYNKNAHVIDIAGSQNNTLTANLD
jgi:serine/threonine-protein phosphatase 2A regulatory subunit B